MSNKTYRVNRHGSRRFSFLGTMAMMALALTTGTPDAIAESALQAAAAVAPASGLDAAPATEAAPKAKPAAEPAAKPAPKAEPASGLEAALEKLKLPGVKINLKERCVDVDGSICLDQGALELIACTKNSKEHESIVTIDAKAKHIHAALLLLGAKPGNPAMQKPVDKERTRWIHIPPQGGPVDVFLVFKDKAGKMVERPINDFIEAYEDAHGGGGGAPGGGEETPGEGENAKFPTHTLVFAGSILHGKEKGPRKYLADQSGNVISLATFGDELLCLPGIYAHAAGALEWQINPTHLPEVDSKVILRLRPQTSPKPDAGAAPAK